MPQSVNLAFAFGLSPERAIEYFRSRGYAISGNWHEVWQEAHARAFTVAHAARLDILQSIRDELDRALTEGTTLADFQSRLEPRLQSMGWWGRQVIVDSQGNAESVQLGSVRRLETIYRTNLQTSYQAGRWQAFDDNKSDRPYLQYVAVMDDRTRPSHAAMNGQVFPADDPIWHTHYPPNGFNCRCRVRALSEKNIQSRGLAVQSSAGRMHEKDVLAGIDKHTGEERHATVSGIEIKGHDGRTTILWTDPGWNYNPGQAAWQPDLKRYDADLARQFRNDTAPK